jgi:hypothetical protein
MLVSDSIMAFSSSSPPILAAALIIAFAALRPNAFEEFYWRL